jgi:hypothetical protein
MSEPDDFVLFTISKAIDMARGSYGFHVIDSANMKQEPMYSEDQFIRNISIEYLQVAQLVMRNQATFEEDVDTRKILFNRAFHLGEISEKLNELDVDSFTVFRSIHGDQATDIYGNIEVSKNKLFHSN